jgi:hypothetical protein
MNESLSLEEKYNRYALKRVLQVGETRTKRLYDLGNVMFILSLQKNEQADP